MSNGFKKIIATASFIFVSLFSLFISCVGLVLMLWTGGGVVEWIMIIWGIGIFILFLFVFIKYIKTSNQTLFWIIISAFFIHLFLAGIYYI